MCSPGDATNPNTPRYGSAHRFYTWTLLPSLLGLVMLWPFDAHAHGVLTLGDMVFVLLLILTPILLGSAMLCCGIAAFVLTRSYEVKTRVHGRIALALQILSPLTAISAGISFLFFFDDKTLVLSCGIAVAGLCASALLLARWLKRMEGSTFLTKPEARRRRSIVVGLLVLATILALFVARWEAGPESLAVAMSAGGLCLALVVLASSWTGIAPQTPKSARSRRILALGLVVLGILGALLPRRVADWAQQQRERYIIATHAYQWPAVLGVAFSPDGSRLAVTGCPGPMRGGRPTTIHLDGSANEQEPRGQFVDAALCGGVVVGAYSEGALTRWSRSDDRALPALSGHRRQVLSLDCAPGGERLASGGLDGALRVWFPRDGVNSLLLETAGLPLVAVAWAGGRVVSANAEGTIRISTLEGDTRVLEIEPGVVADLDASADGSWVAAVGQESTETLLLDLEEGSGPAHRLGGAPEPRRGARLFPRWRTPGDDGPEPQHPRLVHGRSFYAHGLHRAQGHEHGQRDRLGRRW